MDMDLGVHEVSKLFMPPGKTGSGKDRGRNAHRISRLKGRGPAALITSVCTKESKRRYFSKDDLLGFMPLSRCAHTQSLNRLRPSSRTVLQHARGLHVAPKSCGGSGIVSDNALQKFGEEGQAGARAHAPPPMPTHTCSHDMLCSCVLGQRASRLVVKS